MRTPRNFPFAGLLIGLLSTSALSAMTDVAVSAGNSTLRGIVTDGAGKPIRGAIVKATLGGKSIARYTDQDGRYQMPGLESGRYDISVNAYGFAVEKQKKDTSDPAELAIKLSRPSNMAALTSADLRYLFPTGSDAYDVYTTCSTCHGLETVLPMRGLTAEDWQSFLPAMTVNRWGRSFFPSEARNTKLANGLEQVFGPEGVLGPAATPDLSNVKHTSLSDAALRATITEYTIPSPHAMVHSVVVDDSSGTVWFSEYDAASNKAARFNPETEKFEQFSIPVPQSNAHTGTVMRDGSYLVGLDRPGNDGKVVRVDRDGNLTVYEFPGKPSGARMVAVDPSRDDTVWAVAGEEIWRLNTKTKTWEVFKSPVTHAFPEGSYGGMIALPGQRPTARGYAVAVDSKGFPWVTQLDLGIVFKLDPDTGKTTAYRVPAVRSARGIAIDAEDKIWFGDYYGNKLARLDPNTGEVKLYQPPTANSSPYGVTFDPRSGSIWFADTVGNNVTRFDPKSEQFTEYALPTRNTSIRFMGVDRRGRIWYGGFWNGILGVVDPGPSANGEATSTSN